MRADSSAVVKKNFGVAGDAYFEITRGLGKPLPEKNASIVCRELPGTMETAIEEVRNAALPVFIIDQRQPLLVKGDGFFAPASGVGIDNQANADS